jgi:prepilin-type N-terminal cleavage/methylation domain-containing protein
MKKNNKGFSLVELLISGAILGIVMVGIFAFMGVVTNYYSSQSAEVSLQDDLQSTFNYISNLVMSADKGGVTFSGDTLKVVNGSDVTFVRQEGTNNKELRVYSGSISGDGDLLTEYVKTFKVTPGTGYAAIEIEMTSMGQTAKLAQNVYMRNVAASGSTGTVTVTASGSGTSTGSGDSSDDSGVVAGGGTPDDGGIAAGGGTSDDGGIDAGGGTSDDGGIAAGGGTSDDGGIAAGGGTSDDGGIAAGGGTSDGSGTTDGGDSSDEVVTVGYSLSLNASWDGNKNYGLDITNTSSKSISSVSVTIPYTGTVTKIDGNVTGVVNGDGTVTLTYIGNIAPGETKSGIYTHVTGSGNFALGATTDVDNLGEANSSNGSSNTVNNDSSNQSNNSGNSSDSNENSTTVTTQPSTEESTEASTETTNSDMSCTKIVMTNAWSGNKQYEMDFSNGTDKKLDSITVTLHYTGNLTSIGGNVSGHIKDANTVEITFYNYGNGIGANTTYSKIYVTATGVGDFELYQ